MKNYAPVLPKTFSSLAIGVLLFFGSSAWAVDFSATKFYGYIDLEYKQTTADKFDDTGPDDANLKNGSFDQHHFNLLVDVPVSPKLAMKGHIEFEHGLNQGIDSGNVVLEYAFGEYIVRDWLKLRGGKMLTPWGIYNEIHDATPAYLTVPPPGSLLQSLPERRVCINTKMGNRHGRVRGSCYAYQSSRFTI